MTPSDFSAMSRFGGKDAGALKNHAAKVRAIIRDVIYTSKENLYDLFKIGMTGNALDLEGLLRIVSELNCGLPEDEVTLVFKSIPKNKNDKISFQCFEEAFRSEEPSSEEFETVVIRKVREWMFKNKLSSEIAFDALCRSAGRFVVGNGGVAGGAFLYNLYQADGQNWYLQTLDGLAGLLPQTAGYRILPSIFTHMIDNLHSRIGHREDRNGVVGDREYKGMDGWIRTAGRASDRSPDNNASFRDNRYYTQAGVDREIIRTSYGRL